MVQKSDVKALEQTLRDIWSFAKMTRRIVLTFAGDFRQESRIVSRETQSGQINVSLKSYAIWLKIELFTFATKINLISIDARYMRKGIF